MKNIGTRLKLVREAAELTRKDVESSSLGEIKSSSLSSFENNQSMISINYLVKLMYFYELENLIVDYKWLLTGMGNTPVKDLDINSNLNIIKEVSAFKELNKSAILYTVDSSDFAPFMCVGDVLGAIKSNDYSSGIKIVNTKDGGLLLKNAYVNNGVLVYNAPNVQVLKSIDDSDVVGIYDVIWIRKNV